jgi:hypothetical protein
MSLKIAQTWTMPPQFSIKLESFYSKLCYAIIQGKAIKALIS